MKMDKNNNYYIKKIRLINFHNFVNETIEIVDRGHLFVLGDNSSGKTTLIDAVHYVLTAGESMEFNSAARIAGSKSEGRRAQGIITRYNIDKGHLNPNGGITYAALEIIGYNGNPWTVAVGMSVNSPQENLKRWGIIRPGNIESLPFLIENSKGEFRPRTAYEIKKVLGGAVVHLQPQTYKNNLAQQFLGGEKQFKDFCMFLSIGKAYREIASQTSDYHELFKRLLPKPRKDLFEKIIDSLRSLDMSKNEIQTLKGKYEYIKSLLELVQEVKYKRKHAVAGECLALQFEIEDLKNTIVVLENREKYLEKELSELEITYSSADKNRKYIVNQIEDYKQKDAGGLIREEENIRERIKQIADEKETRERNLEKFRVELNNVKKTYEQNIKKIYGHYQSFLAKFSKISVALPFSIGELISTFEKFIHMKVEATTESVQEINFEEYYKKASAHKDSCIGKNTKLENIHTKHLQDIQDIEDEIKKREEQLEFVPEVEYYSEIVTEFDQTMVDYKPLYKGLVWNSGVEPREMDAVEEFIGNNILCSLILKEQDFRKVSEFVFSDYPGIRIIPEKRLNLIDIDIPQWIKKYFDLGESDPDSVKALAIEMIADDKVELSFDKECVSVSFRAHKRGFSGLESYIIGEENRKLKIKKLIESLRLDLKNLNKAETEVNEEIKQNNRLKQTLVHFIEYTNKNTRQLENCLSKLNNDSLLIKTTNSLIREKQGDLVNLISEDENLKMRLKNIQEIIRTEGLKNVEDKIKELQQKLKGCDKQIKNIERKIWSNETLKSETEIELQEKIKKLTEKKTNYRKVLHKFTEKSEESDIESYFNEQRSTLNLHNADDCRNMAGKAKLDEVKYKARILERIYDKRYSIEFGFNYSEDKNLLVDRANRNIKDICNRYDAEIREQQEIINERTTELFRKIIMDELVYYLRERIEHLQTMVKNINSLLGNRYFGNNQYVFKIKVQPQYERFISIIKKYNPMNEEIEKELQNFFKDYRNEIVDTEPNEIPEILDYRNWYVYEMYVKSPESKDNVMDKRVKSIGSGGEQSVPNYLLVLTISHFLYSGTKIKLPVLIFDEAFYGIDAGRRDQLMGFAGDIGLQIFIATPDQDGVRKEISHSTSLLIVKDINYDVHLYPFHWKNPDSDKQGKFKLFDEDKNEEKIQFEKEL
ncbi:MAG: hypothetical protein K9M56_07295 [Victivallales bacterium]|nr:hypothetical protein [Victivallales bacterium]